MSRTELAELGRTLSDSFCQGLDRRAILDAIRRGGPTSARDTVVSIWGIEDAAVLDKLMELELTAETVAAISLTPLVEVAWADGKVDKKERAAVLEAARDFGLTRQDVSYMLLEGRLGERPDAELSKTWKSYVRLLARILDAATISALRDEILVRAERVAEASGGLLGLGSKISASERSKLDELARAFD
jgi:hypothetical protein